MSSWVKFNIENPPENWCFVKDPKSTSSGKLILVRWSRSHYCWIGFDLNPLMGGSLVDQYLETDYSSLNDMIYNPRPKRPDPKYYEKNC